MSKSVASKEKKPKTRTIGGKNRKHTASLWKKKRIEEHKQKMDKQDKK